MTAFLYVTFRDQSHCFLTRDQFLALTEELVDHIAETKLVPVPAWTSEAKVA